MVTGPSAERQIAIVIALPGFVVSAGPSPAMAGDGLMRSTHQSAQSRSSRP